MAGAVTSPVAYDLTVAGLPAKVYSTGVTADADGFYYTAGQLVEIAADETIKAAATAGAAIGILEDSIRQDQPQRSRRPHPGPAVRLPSVLG